jgi:pimeloyl-ACP methyl ester carboxylesterase
MEELFELIHQDKEILGILSIPGTEDIIEKYPCIIMCYGFNGNRVDVNRISVKLSRVLNNLGFAYIRFDYLGCGVSGGLFHDYLLSDRVNQVDTIMQFALSHPKIDTSRIGIIGFSDGCKVVLDSITKIKIPVKSVALWSPLLKDPEISDALPKTGGSTSSRGALKRNKLDGKFYYSGYWGGLWVNPGYFTPVGDSYIERLEEVINAYPTLCVLGGNDNFIKTTKKEINQRLRNKPFLNLYTVDGANHVYSSTNWIRELFEVSVQHFARSMGGIYEDDKTYTRSL